MTRTAETHAIEPAIAGQPVNAERNIALWVDLMDACEQFLLAGLRHKIGPDGDLRAAYREWYARQMDAHDEWMIRMVREIDRRSRPHGR